MTRLLLLLAAWISITTTAMAQSKPDTLRDPQNGQLVLRGAITAADLHTASFQWMDSGMQAYQPDAPTIDRLIQPIQQCRMLVFMGTWCDDSHNLIPKFYKILQLTDYPAAIVMLYGMDREKTSGTGIEKTYGATLLPTIIFYRNDKEIGRIIETVSSPLEAEMEKIILSHGGK